MKTHTTNYQNTFIQVAEDCPASCGLVPEVRKGKETVASLQFKLLNDNPYRYTSDEILFQVFAIRNNLASEEMDLVQKKIFSKGQACFRASPLPKRYGWGIHSNHEGRIALIAEGSQEYIRLSRDPDLVQLKAMRTSRK